MPLTTSYWPADTSVPVLDTTVGGVLRDAVMRAPDRLALVEGLPDPARRRRWTYSELLADAGRCAAALLARFRPGEHVAVWAHNIPEWVILEFGAGLAGMVLVTVNPAYRPRELAYVLRQSRAAGIFLVPELRGSSLLAAVAEVRGDVPGLREVIRLDEWEGFIGGGDAAPTLPPVGPDDVAQIQYTSGTTGAPKGALLRHRGITNNGRFTWLRLGVGPGDVHVNPMPLFHTGGCVLAALGAVQSLAAHVLVPAFEPGLVLNLIENERATTLGAVPTMLIALLEHPDFAARDLSSLRAICSGGATVPAPLVRKVEALTTARFNIVFGQTETSPVITQTLLDDTPEDKAETIGLPLPRTEVRIVDPAGGAVVPPGTVGELCARGYLVMAGYYDMPEASAATIDADGWLHTGDLASMDARGYCRIEGRLKDMIIRGGENIYPREIEEVLYAHPGVADVAVIGVPDERWGEQVAAYVRPREPRPTADELDAFARERLAAYKVPRYWAFVDEFPLTPSGKIQKFKLRERFLAEHDPAARMAPPDPAPAPTPAAVAADGPTGPDATTRPVPEEAVAAARGDGARPAHRWTWPWARGRR